MPFIRRSALSLESCSGGKRRSTKTSLLAQQILCTGNWCERALEVHDFAAGDEPSAADYVPYRMASSLIGATLLEPTAERSRYLSPGSTCE